MHSLCITFCQNFLPKQRHPSVVSATRTMSSNEAAITIRPVEVNDDEKGLFDVLSQLTEAPLLSHHHFKQLVEQQRRQDVRHTLVAVNHHDRIIATASAFIELKFIRRGLPCGHIEDIVVDRHARGTHVGQRLVTQLVDFCKNRHCYKVILDCSQSNIPFYQKCGFVVNETQMSLYF